MLEKKKYFCFKVQRQHKVASLLHKTTQRVTSEVDINVNSTALTGSLREKLDCHESQE